MLAEREEAATVSKEVHFNLTYARKNYTAVSALRFNAGDLAGRAGGAHWLAELMTLRAQIDILGQLQERYGRKDVTLWRARGYETSGKMPCEKCEKKMSKLVTPDPKEGNKRAVGVNKLIEKAVHKDQLAPKGAKCKLCNTKLHWKGKYCPPCAHIHGKCWMCGKKIFDTFKHCMSLV